MKNHILYSLNMRLFCAALLLLLGGDFCQAKPEVKILENAEEAPSGEIFAEPDEEVAAGSDEEVSEETNQNIQPLKEPESEIFPVRKTDSPILPEEVVQAGLKEFSAQIQESSEPGTVFTSPHFWVQADSYWEAHSDQLTQIVQDVEAIRYEAEMTAALWRKPLFSSSSDLNAPPRPLHKSLEPEFSGEKIRLRIVTPGTPEPVVQTLPPPKNLIHAADHPEWGTGLADVSLKPCRFEAFAEGSVLTLEIQDLQDLESGNLRQNLRREVFRSTLRDGQEFAIFPLWLQNGLAEVFAGQKAEISEESASKPQKNRLRDWLSGFPTHSDEEDAWNSEETQKVVSLLRFCMTSNDGRAFFPFWGQLADAYSDGREDLRELNQQKPGMNVARETVRSWETAVFENQEETQKRLESFFQKIEANPQNESLSAWLNVGNPNESKSAPNSYRVFWNPEAQVLNAEISEAEALPRLQLDDSWKENFEEMALVLKLVDFYQKTRIPPETNSHEVNGVLIQEFGNPEDASEPSVSDENEEDSAEAKPEELQKLTEVYSWFESSRNVPTVLNLDGTILSGFWTPKQLKRLFFPKNRAYLLQEFNGNPVLSATFNDDYVLHVILEKSDQKPGVSEIRVLGIEEPDTP